ncbi:YPDG domain-containing protein [Corynebacterium aquatimens]|uniref:YPDG domain-containing protein n=1 Tax=Corynebacterium aquatimens TaxID=1190508 RepID=UPI0025B3676A|nr:YPDG domain-containing protein [Corynebacterium aquatimens]WJY65058.1 hypothetical protein CAQUA_01615 [Corynebacterium aquatimens]
MSKKVIRRRGTTVAAAALSVALVAPVVQPVVSVAREPEGVNLTCVDRGQPFTPWDAKFTPDTAQWVSGAARTAEKRDAIEVGYINSSTDFTNAKSTISGWVHLAGTGTVTNGTGEAVAEGTPVYMQWRSATGAISPVYVTYTHNNVGGAQASPGTYAFDLREGFFDSNGQYHVYEAYNDQFYRVWTEPGVNGDPQNGGTGSIIYPVRFGNGIVPRWANSMGAGRATGQFQLVGVNVQRVDIKMGELPIDPVTGVNYMRAGGKNGPLVETPAGTQPKFGGNFVSGRVWREGGRGADSINLITGPAYATGSNHGDSALEGYKVYLTTLTEEGRAQITNIQDGATETDKVRAVRDALKANPEYLEKTYVGTTDAQGNYAIHVDVPAYAKNFDDYTQNVYMWVEDPHGVIVQAHTRFARPVFTNAAGPSNWSPIPTPAALSGLKYANNFAVTGYPQDSNLNMYVKDYDETLHQAKRGATAELVIDGALPPVETRVVWVKTGERDANGKTVATSQVVNPDGSQKMSSGTRPRAITDPYHSEAGTKLDTCGDLSDTAKFGLKVPDTAEDGDIYTAMLFVGDEVRAADSFAVSAGESARYDVTYDRVSKADAPNPGDNGKQTADSTVGGVDVKVGNVVSGKPKVTDDQNPGTTTDQLPDGAKLGPVSAQRGTSLDRWKENFRNDRGFEYDDIQFTDDGRVVLPAVPYGKQDEILKLPVVVTYQDGTKDLLEIEVETEEKLANKLQPRYDEKRVHKGDDNVAIEAPKFFDADGKPVAAKPVAKFELNPGSRRDRQLPDGWNARDITVDPNTGAITITKVPAGAKPGLNQIPVLVTYYQDEAAKAAGTEDSHEIAYVPVYILGTADDFEPRFGDVRKEKGQDFSSEAPTFHDPATGEVKDLPADAKPKFELKTNDGQDFNIAPGNDELRDKWNLKIDPATGVVTGTIPDDAEVVNGIHPIPVKVTYADGTVDDVFFNLFVGKPTTVENTTTDPDGKVVVDPSKITPVDSNGEEQPTGVTIVNPDADTKVTATDGDGKPVEVRVTDPNADGKSEVVVTPGEDVKGPITIVIKDPDLKSPTNPNGEVTAVVPVNPAVVGENTNVPADGKEHPVGTVTNPKGGETGKLVDGNGTKIPGSKVEIDDQGKIKVTVPAGTDPKDATVVVNDKGGNKIGELPVKITKPETDKTGITVNPIKPGDTVIEGKGPANGSVTVTVTDKDGKEKFKETKTTDGNGNWKVTVPGGVAVGDTVTVESNGNTETIKVVREGLSSQLEGATKDGVSKKDMCVGSLIGMGVPLALLVPVGLALAAGLPALRPVIDQVSFQIQSANTALQQQLGIFNPDMARAIAQVDLQLKEARISLGQVAFGLALLAAGLTAVGVVASNCSPNEKTGSSGFAKLSPKSTRTSTTKKTTETKPSTSKTSTSATTTKSTTASTSTSTATSTTPAATTAPTATETQ